MNVLILSNPTDQNRLQRVKLDLESMGKTYTQLEVNDWETYATPDWIEHYYKVLMPGKPIITLFMEIIMTCLPKHENQMA